jgi:hypothetical protein
MLSVIYAEFREQAHLAECHYAECRGAGPGEQCLQENVGAAFLLSYTHAPPL